jgi:hypothetical protein
MNKLEFNDLLIKKHIKKIKFSKFEYEENNIFTYSVDSNFVNIDHNFNSMTIQNSGKEIFFNFDESGEIHGIKLITDDYSATEYYDHGVPHGKWDHYQTKKNWTKNYVNGVLDGNFVIRENKEKIIGSYKNGVYDGSIDYYKFENGVYKSQKTEIYKNGVLLDSIDHTISRVSLDTSITLPIKISQPRIWKTYYYK